MVLDAKQHLRMEQRLMNDRKSAGMAYFLWGVFGAVGGHRFYLGRPNTGTVQLVLCVVGLAFLVAHIGLFILIALAVWVLADAVLIPKMIAKDQNEKRLVILRESAVTAG